MVVALASSPSSLLPSPSLSLAPPSLHPAPPLPTSAMSAPSTSSAAASSLPPGCGCGRLPRFRFQSLCTPTGLRLRNVSLAPSLPLLGCAGARPRQRARVSAAALPLPVTPAAFRSWVEEGGGSAAPVRRVAVALACGALAAAWCRRAMAVGAEAGAPGAMEAAAILLLTEITPKSVAVHNDTEVSRFVVSEPYVAEGELNLMLRGAELSGAIAEDEQDIIENVLEIKDTHVREVMTPLVDVVAIDAAAPLIDFKSLWETHKYSRVPVFEERIDNIVGIAYAMDMLEYVEEVEKLNEITVKEIAHMPTYFVPDLMSVWNLLREFRIRQVHMAVVLNEYGGTIGIVTLEDVVEEIVGEIFDENDSKEEIQKKTGNIVKREDGTYDVDANTSIDHLSEELGIKLPEGHQYETVSGFVCESFGYIPEEGGKMLVILEKDYREENAEYQEEGSDRQDEREKTQAYELEIIEANARKVVKVLFKPISSECVDVDNNGVNRLISKKIVKRKRKDSGDSSEAEDECSEITENGCPAELLSYSDDKRSELEDASSSSTR